MLEAKEREIEQLRSQAEASDRQLKIQIKVNFEKESTSHLIQGGFFNWSALKMTKCQITCKSLKKSFKCQNFLRVWHLVIFRADQLKKPPCI